jgi:phosphate transport system substrate-binding protein
MRSVFRRALLVVAAVLVVALAVGTPQAQAAPARINGSGSSYVGLAMQQWVADATTNGLQTNYLPTSSPQGLQAYGTSTIDFAGTEAEFSALGKQDPGAGRGYQYVPDVAGAVAIMYNVDDPSGKPLKSLHLSRVTVAKIFMGLITSWDDPAITADNKGYPLPAQPITVVYRSGESGTTALFYDFVAHVAPNEFAAWAAKNQLPTDVRIISLPQTFAPKTVAQGSSDQIAQFTGSGAGKWSISYDEFGYAKTYNVPAAWIQNESGEYVQPYAQNIAAALKSATLRQDLSQELSGVYVSKDPAAYPISAYSYMVTQCAADGARPTCKGAYASPGITETLAKWLRYIACDGQANMAAIGYSPLPPNLSNEIAKSIARMQGGAPEVLTADNCANPTFTGSVGKAPPPPADPIKNVAPRAAGAGVAGGAGGGAGAGGAKSGAGAGTNTATTVAGATDPGAVAEDPAAASEELAVGADGVTASGAAAGAYRATSPVGYDRPDTANGFPLAILFVLALIIIPPVIGSGMSARKGR